MAGRSLSNWEPSFLSGIKGVKQEPEGDCYVCIICIVTKRRAVPSSHPLHARRVCFDCAVSALEFSIRALLVAAIVGTVARILMLHARIARRARELESELDHRGKIEAELEGAHRD